ncbi:hypothetical protein ABWW58_04895 [Sporolactobacillus sp. STCC-11]|uniref:hypothetical protein n=1 Tax=Sporolactobacillus caesalpiniae TaxID=3230362 RepID=UPI003398C580
MLSGRILDKFGASWTVRIGTTLIAITLISFVLVHTTLTVGKIVIIYALFMLGVGLALANIMTNGIKILPELFKADGNAI